MPEFDKTLLSSARTKFHKKLLESGVLTVDKDGVPSNADKGQKLSRAIATSIAHELLASMGNKSAGQTSGALFEEVVASFVRDTFPLLQHLRPGSWEVMRLGNHSRIKTEMFSQYEHLEYLDELSRENARLSTIIGNDYLVAPDVVVYRHPCSDEEINAPFAVVDESTSTMSDLRAVAPDGTERRPILHASISAKWTMRSDRAQNSRTEALNLIRNRKGTLPHIVVVTGEPVPSRIASLALGTGDIDCTYHFALYELERAVAASGNDEAASLLDTLIAGRRLKDISDLPLDLCV